MPPDSLPAGRASNFSMLVAVRSSVILARRSVRTVRTIGQKNLDTSRGRRASDRGCGRGPAAYRRCGHESPQGFLVGDALVEDHDLAGLDLLHARDEPEQSRLADAVGSDHADHDAGRISMLTSASEHVAPYRCDTALTRAIVSTVIWRRASWFRLRCCREILVRARSPEAPRCRRPERQRLCPPAALAA